MTARQSSAVDHALRLIGRPRSDGKPHTAHSAAQAAGIAVTTIYRALDRQKPRVKVSVKQLRERNAELLAVLRELLADIRQSDKGHGWYCIDRLNIDNAREVIANIEEQTA